MRTGDWSALEAAFAALVDLPPEKRAARLAKIRRTEPALGARLEALLGAHDDADRRLARFELLTRPPGMLPSVRADDAGADGAARVAAGEPVAGDAAAVADPLGIIGRTIAHFHVRDVLGTGGMGVAYRADDTRLGRTVALKFLLPQYAPDADARRRFVQEARAASALEHPNICMVLDIGESEHGLFIAMPAYGGETLQERLARDGVLAVDDALALIVHVLRGLAAAHAAGITHRDLKPANLVVMPDGAVKILDFGLAMVRDIHLSAPGTLAGTVAYMSPEQLEGRDVDQRTDLWSAGVVLYEMLTGARPFGGGHDLSTVYAILHEEPASPSSRAPGMPAAVERVVVRLLQKGREERFATALEALQAVEAVRAGDESASARSTQRAPWPLPASPRARGVLAATALAALVIAIPAVRAGLRLAVADRAPAAGSPSEPAAMPGAARASVAVLPFVDTSPAGDQGHLGEGMAAEILNALTQVDGLRVPARTSSFAFSGRELPLREIGRQLEVATVLEGSVHRAGDRVRVTARLVDTRDDRHLWAQTFDRRLSDIFAVQSEIAATVAEALRLRLTVPAAAPPTRNLAAYELYLRGLFHWNRRTPQDLRQALDFFTQATQHDSTYAQAHAGIALTWVVLQLTDASVGSAQALERSRVAAERALALDSAVAEAWAARGYASHWQWHWRDAEADFQRAIALNPAYATAFQWYGEHLAKMGRPAEGEQHVRRAIALDPLSLVAQNDLALVLMLARRYEEAIAQLERVRRADPGFSVAHLLLHRTHILVGDTAAAASAGRRWAELVGMSNPEDMVVLAHATRDSNQRAAAFAVLERWQASATARWPDIAMYYALFEEHDRAIDALERAFAQRTPMLASLRFAPWFDDVRADPRAVALIRAMGLD